MEPVNWSQTISHAISTVDWGLAGSTLIIRFVGIFVVLGILQIVMQITGRIFAYLDAKKHRQARRAVAPSEELTQEEAAAVAMALYLYDRNSN